LVEGKLENRKGIIHVIVGRVEALNDSVSAAVPNKSRDFH
jgi:error-prone DNA polymerase